jgi:hypothetical protein
MKIKSLGIVLFLVFCLVGFSMSNVDASNLIPVKSIPVYVSNENFHPPLEVVTLNEDFNTQNRIGIFSWSPEAVYIDVRGDTEYIRIRDIEDRPNIINATTYQYDPYNIYSMRIKPNKDKSLMLILYLTNGTVVYGNNI